MEINAISQLRRAAGRMNEKKTEAQESKPSGTEQKTDSLSVTERAVEQLKEQNQRIMNLLGQDQQEKKLPSLWEMVENAGETASDPLDSFGENLKVVDRCQKISARIMRGDKVPPQDEQYLMQNDPEGYKLTLAMRKFKKHPKKWESVLKDEEKKATEESGDAEEASCEEACEASGETSGSGGSGTADAGE